MQMQALADSLNRDRDRQLVLERSLKDVNLTELIEAGAPTRARVAPADTSRLTATEQLERAEAGLKDKQSTLTELHPDIVAMKQRIAELRKNAETERARPSNQPKRASRTRFAGTVWRSCGRTCRWSNGRSREKMAEGERLRAVLLNYQRRIEVEPTREAELAALMRDYDTLQQVYRGLLTKKQESEIAVNLERQQIGAQFKVLDPARLPERPFAPNRPRLHAIGALAGLGIGLVFWSSSSGSTAACRPEDDVRVALGLPVLATIPLVSPRRPGLRRAATVVSLGTAIFAGAVALAWRLMK